MASDSIEGLIYARCFLNALCVSNRFIFRVILWYRLCYLSLHYRYWNCSSPRVSGYTVGTWCTWHRNPDNCCNAPVLSVLITASPQAGKRIQAEEMTCSRLWWRHAWNWNKTMWCKQKQQGWSETGKEDWGTDPGLYSACKENFLSNYKILKHFKEWDNILKYSFWK